MLNNISINLFNSPYENVNHWKRVISVKQNITLADFHLVILSLLEFRDDGHLFQFKTACKSLDGNVCLESLEECKIHYSRIDLQNVFTNGVSRIFYNFDFGDNWVFEIKQTLNSPIKIIRDNYRIIESSGTRPRQYKANNHKA